MPIYEYHCDACGNDFERLLRRADEKVACACGSEKVVRRLSVFAAHTNTKPAARKPGCATCPMGGSCELN